MSVKQRLDNQSKLIALNILKVCREEKQNGKLFLPLASHLARASTCMLTGVPERSLVRFRTGNLHKTVPVRSDRINWKWMTLTDASFVGQSMTCLFLGRCFQQLKHLTH